MKIIKMAALADIYIKTETIEKILATLRQKGQQGVSITIGINDESNQYGQNVSAYISQTQEDRKDQKKKFYIANGKVFWHDNKIEKGVKQNTENTQTDKDLPF
jgi:hypothetical protein